jgi:hypothetical protein
MKAKGMNDARCLATSHGNRPGTEIVKLTGKRLPIEESLRHQRVIKTNTIKTRMFSLLNQGHFHCAALPRTRAD